MGANDTRGWIVKKSITPDSEWQRIWFASRHRNWTSLALVPSDAEVDVAPMADMLATTGRLHGERPVHVVDARGVQLESLRHIVDSIAAIVGRNEYVVVPVDPVADNPAAIAILRACSDALLVVRLGESMLTVAQNTIDIVDRDRFLGGVVIDGARRRAQPTLEPAAAEL
jgi:hypothetical protein